MPQNLLVWDAVIAWRNDTLKKEIFRKSKVVYLSSMAKLIERGFIDIEQPLPEFIKSNPEEKVKIINATLDWSSATKLSRRTIFRAFHKFAKRKKIKPTDIKIPFNGYQSLEMLAIYELLSSNEDKAKSQHLTPNDINRFLLELRDLNMRDFRICWTMWELKFTIHQVLNSKVCDYNLSNGIFIINEYEGRYGNLRDDLKQHILEQMKGKNDKDLLFTTDKGNRIHPGQIVRNMKLASKRAKLPIIISPKILYAHAKAHYERSLQAIPERERKKIFAELALQQEQLAKS